MKTITTRNKLTKQNLLEEKLYDFLKTLESGSIEKMAISKLLENSDSLDYISSMKDRMERNMLNLGKIQLVKDFINETFSVLMKNYYSKTVEEFSDIIETDKNKKHSATIFLPFIRSSLEMKYNEETTAIYFYNYCKKIDNMYTRELYTFLK